MNDIPLIKMLPEKYQGWAIAILALAPWVTRFYHAMTSGSGIIGSIKAVLYGTNTPKTPEPKP